MFQFPDVILVVYDKSIKRELQRKPYMIVRVLKIKNEGVCLFPTGLKKGEDRGQTMSL
jgi:hypothetical protein